MTEHDRPTQSGTHSKAQQHKPSAHYETTSPGLRFTAHNLRTKAAKKNRKRSTSFVLVWSFIPEEKKQPLRANDDVEDRDRDDSQGQSKSSVNFALFVAGYAGLARLWYVALIFPIKEEGSLILNKNVFKIGTYGWHCTDCSWIAFFFLTHHELNFSSRSHFLHPVCGEGGGGSQ